MSFFCDLDELLNESFQIFSSRIITLPYQTNVALHFAQGSHKKHVYFMASCVSKNTLKLAKFGFGRRVQQ